MRLIITPAHAEAVDAVEKIHLLLESVGRMRGRDRATAAAALKAAANRLAESAERIEHES